jgi:hypothetical protein
MIWQGASGVSEAHRGTAVPSSPYSPFFLTTEGKHSRDSRGDDRIDPESEIEEIVPSGYNVKKLLVRFQ